uniref:C-type lectin domain-containing protein n=2 Tax=Caenorhabditis tropicalis TaxID=1561998 RepID=A0A1I7UBM2_9PELO
MNKSVVLAEMAPGWTLMGIADIWEYEYFEKFATGYLPYNNYTKLGFWMDGIRKSSCKFPVTPSVACNGTNEFTYSDKTAPNPQFEWLPGQPDGIQNEPPDSNCLYLRVSSDGENGVDDMP